MRHAYQSVLVVPLLLVAMLNACSDSNSAPSFPAPTLTAVSPDRGVSGGGRTITLTGTGFTANGAGTNSVTIGGAAATNVIAVSDNTLMVDTPTGTQGARNVVVSNVNGMATLAGAYNYVDPVLFAVTARTAAQSQPGSLYRIDPATGAGTLVGATGDVMTGIAFDPTFTTMYGLNTSPFADQSMFTVDVTTGATTLLGATGDPPTNNVGDLTFVGSLLVGNSWNGEFCSFDLTTGVATLIGNNGAYRGLAIAADAAQTLYLSFGNTQTLHTIDPDDGALTVIAVLSGDIAPGENLSAMTFLDGVLYAQANPPGTTTARLVTVDPATAVVTFVGFMPDSIDALEGTIR